MLFYIFYHKIKREPTNLSILLNILGLFQWSRKKYKVLSKNSNFDYLPHGEKGTYPMNFRIVRFPIAEGKYEVLITNLPKNEFSIEELKELYHMRWGIETSFRELKYSIGLIHFHSKKVEHINQ